MSFFPGFGGSDFTPLFRLLDDYDSHRTGNTRTASIHNFQPKFDVRETKEEYVLHGELAGVDQENVTIEFADPTTLVVKGHVERSYTSGDPATAGDSGRITSAEADDHNKASHHATVEDEKSEATTSGDNQTQLEKAQDGTKQQVSRNKPQHPNTKFWIAERAVGNFHRSFSFPTRVDQDNVKAGLKNGILTVSIPKLKPQQAKKINIE